MRQLGSDLRGVSGGSWLPGVPDVHQNALYLSHFTWITREVFSVTSHERDTFLNRIAVPASVCVCPSPWRTQVPPRETVRSACGSHPVRNSQQPWFGYNTALSLYLRLPNVALSSQPWVSRSVGPIKPSWVDPTEEGTQACITSKNEPVESRSFHHPVMK
jgi:hypothetical protein